MFARETPHPTSVPPLGDSGPGGWVQQAAFCDPRFLQARSRDDLVPGPLSVRGGGGDGGGFNEPIARAESGGDDPLFPLPY
jgi:hypothetical protein